MKTLLALEPRILFDGAALVTGAEVVQDQTTQDQANTNTDADAESNSGANTATDGDALWFSGLPLATPTDRQEIVFIDTRVEDYQTLMDGIDPAAEVILLDARRDGIKQIAEVLRERTDIDAIHLIGEGNAAELHLGTTFLTQEAIGGRYASLFEQIGTSLSANADLLIYGCNFGQGDAGLGAMKTLAELTGADIAASTDRTGHVSEYGNWVLETATGFIETSMVIGEATQAAWEGVLATFTVTNTNDSGAGSLRQAIIDANATPGTDTIVIPTGTYVLTTGLLQINDHLIITGAGATTTIIDGNANDRVFEIRGSSITTMSGVTIQNGRASGNGAGVLVDNSSILNLSDAILTNNDGMGGDGGAFHVHGTLNLNRVLIDNNQANKGAGIYFHNAIGGTLTNVTISGNTATNEGGGIWTENPITIMNSTIAFNTAPVGGGVYDNHGMEITITNSILHNPGSPNSFGTLISGGNNIDRDGTAGLGDPLDGQDPMLGALADNGGPTRTHALLADSPALNAGTTTGAPAVDQRGFTRDAAPDIGAYEYKSSAFISKSEFRINDPSGNNEQTSGPVRGAERAVDIAPNGDYVVVWTNGTANDKVFAKVLDAGGNQKVAQFQVNIGGGTNAWTDVAVDDSGNFLVTWTQGGDIFMRRFFANGTAVDAGDVIVNTGTANTQHNPSVNMNGAGNFIIAWEGDGGGNEGVFVRRGNMGGGLIGSDITVNTAAAAQDPSVGISDSGDFVVVWDNGSDVSFRLYNSAGALQNSGQVDAFLQLSAGGAAVDMSGDGRFTVTYQASLLGTDVFVRQYDSAGNPLFSPKTVNTSTAGTQANPSITMDDIGEFIVVWEGAGDRPGQNDTAGVFGQKFNSSGQKIGVEFLINQTTANTQDRASVAMLDRDNFVAVWTGSDGAQTDIFARQYGATTSPTLDLDVNNSSGAMGNDYALTFTEDDGPTAIADSDTNLADVDNTTFTYVTLSVSGLLDGNAEVLILDGDTFALATDAPGQDTSGGTYHVRVSTATGTAIMTIIKQSGGSFSEVEAETLIKAIQYQHLDTATPTDGDRLIEVRVNDGTTDSAAARTTINVNPVNDAPLIATNTGITVNEASTGNVLTTAMFNEGDPDDAGIGLTYTVTAVTTNGTLRLSGTALALNDTFTQDDIDTNRVTYDHNGSETTTDSFSFSLADGGEDGAVPATGVFTFTITPVNDAPSVATNTGITVNEGSTGNVLTTAMLNEGDPDDAGTGLTYTVTAVTTNGTLRLSGTALGLNDTFTQDDIDTNRVTYDHNGSETTTDTFSFSLADGGENGTLPATGAFTLTITPANDPPTFSGLDNTPTFTAGGSSVILDNNATIADSELDATNNYNGATLTLVRNGGANAEDVFAGSGSLSALTQSGSLVVSGATIGTVTTNSGGTLALTFNGNATTARVNAAFQQITYANSSAAPPPGVQIDYTFNDGNAGAHGSGGALNDSGAIIVNIISVNNSPTLRSVPLTLNPGTEDAGPPVGAVGTLVSSLMDLDTIPGGHDNVTDPDSGGLTGMAVTQVDATNGAWFYSTDNGANWFALTGVNPNAARLLAADGATRIYFQPNPDYFGTITSGIRFRAWDQVNGSNGAVGDTPPPGGMSGFSTAQAHADITINPVDDPPIITSNGGGVITNVTVITGSTAVTDVNATDADGDTLTYSIIGGADAALFSIDPATGVLMFITAPDFQAPGDAGGDNIYDVIVQASDGTAVDTQALAVTVAQANVPPQIFIPPPPDSPPSSDPPPKEIGDKTSEDQVPINGGSPGSSSPGNIIPDGGQGSTTTGARESGTGNTPGPHELPARQQEVKPTGLVDVVSDIMEFLQKPFDRTVFKDEIRSLLTRSRFLQDLDRVRDDVQDVTATEKTYVASSIAVSTGLSIGYVIWLLRSGVLLTALLSSVPAWQFVNPLLVLDSAAKKKRQKGQKDVEDDSVESLFEKPTAAADTTETKGGLIPKTRRFLQPWRTEI